VEYGCLRDRKFYDKVKDSVLFEKCAGGFATLTEYLETAKEKHENKIYYAADKTAQAQYISMLEGEDIEVVLLDRVLDTQFIQMVESQNSGVKFVRADAEIASAMAGEGETPAMTAASELFKTIAGEHTTVEVQMLKDASVPAILTVSEESRRMDDMMKMYAMQDGGMSGFPLEAKLILNAASPLIAKIEEAAASDTARAEMIARQVYTLSLLSQRKLSAEELTKFLSDSYELLGKL